MTAVEQDSGHTDQHVFRDVVDEETLELCGQLPSTVPLIPFKGRCDGPAEEVSGLLPPGCRGLANRRAQGAGEGKAEQNLT
ncbi:hypothetical protein SMIR_41915 (plasmid) [Streptomyces mirabilis]|uniref:hypothetical protein n=1 Tax=Streptomyces mirabilis TaxID=68239 RepID=UPI001BAEBB64|nr:hypothetical protein [Streptomyces mirabilis]QUW85606.1 hypothetical protein SMIR_41915 [Streptomyces mirabilis]